MCLVRYQALQQTGKPVQGALCLLRATAWIGSGLTANLNWIRKWMDGCSVSSWIKSSPSLKRNLWSCKCVRLHTRFRSNVGEGAPVQSSCAVLLGVILTSASNICRAYDATYVKWPMPAFVLVLVHYMLINMWSYPSVSIGSVPA